MVLDVILGSALNFARVLDDDKAHIRLDNNDMVEHGIDQRGLARSGAPDHKDIAAASNRILDAIALPRRHDPRGNVIVRGEYGDGFLADGKDDAGNYWRNLAGEARAIQGKFTFQRWVATGKFAVMIAGYGVNDALRSRAGHCADAAHGFAQAFLPQSAVSIKHDLDSSWILQRRKNVFSQITRKFLFSTLADEGCFFWEIHLSFQEYILDISYNIPIIYFNKQ